MSTARNRLADQGINIKTDRELKQLKPCDQNIQQTIEIANQMIALAEKGDADREDSGCGVLYGVMLDSAYRIRALAEKEKREHIKKGWWKE
ncbi:MAG: hypothetical protein AB1724_11455 [Thermodesulfobacteriota bacterium]